MRTLIRPSTSAEAQRLVRVFLGLTVAAGVVAVGRFAGTGEFDALLLPAWPGYFAAVVWTSDYETQ